MREQLIKIIEDLNYNLNQRGSMDHNEYKDLIEDAVDEIEEIYND
jgi:hypothetical protein